MRVTVISETVQIAVITGRRKATIHKPRSAAMARCGTPLYLAWVGKAGAIYTSRRLVACRWCWR